MPNWQNSLNCDAKTFRISAFRSIVNNHKLKKEKENRRIFWSLFGHIDEAFFNFNTSSTVDN